jgi:hypothetical protein
MDQLKRKYDVRAFQPGDEEVIVKLLELVFDGWPKFDLLGSSLEYWRWKYLNNPFRMNQIAVGASDNRIVGCLHSFSLRIKIGNKVCLGTQTFDLAVHPDFRRMVIFNKMLDLAQKMRKESGSKFHYYLTWNPWLRKRLSKFYHKFSHIVTRLYRIHDVGLQLRKQPMKYAFIYRYGFHLGKLANQCRNALRTYCPPSYDFHIGKMTHFDERIEGFWEEVKDHYHFIVERSRDYLNWRYCDPRGGDYLVKVAQRDAKILGYMVLRVDRHQQDYPVGYIVDLLTLPNRLDVATALVEDAVNYFDGHHINIILCMVIKNHPCEAILKRNGFITRRERVPLFYREYAEVEKLRGLGESSPRRIHFAYGDLDVI